jgi:membrane protease YdiL (CAAX protease family)
MAAHVTPWGLKDVVWVTGIVVVVPLLVSPLLSLIISGDGDVGRKLFLASGYLFILFVPLLWTRKYHGASFEDLGIKKGRWPVIITVLLGAGAGVGYYLLESVVVGRKVVFDFSLLNAVARTALWGFSFHGFIGFVFGPISEEVYFRGFLYGYLKGRLGIRPGLLLQALIFSLFHVGFLSSSTTSLALQKIATGFGVGLLCGILYETSGNLLCPIVYHSAVNFMASVLQIHAN